MLRVRLTVLRWRGYASDTWFEVYADLGSGEIDEAHPLPPGAVRFWPEAAPRDGHLRDGHLRLRHLDSVDPDGHLETLHLDADHLYPAWPVVVESPAYVFGRFQHRVRVYDEAGNTSAEPAAEQTVSINTAPNPPGRLHYAGQSAGGELTFAFAGSRFAPVRGL